MNIKVLKRWLSAVAFSVFALATVAQAQSGWVPVKLNTAGHDLNTVYFIDSKRGWVGGDGGFLSRTDDGGQSWIRQTVGTTAAINDIYFRDKEAGFFLAGNSIFITRDNGATWTQSKIFSEEFDGADIELYSLRFSSKKKGWAVGSVSKHDRVVDSVLVYTDDGGETWRRQRAPSRLELIHIDFVSDKRGWIVGDGGTILYTRDGGQSWTKQKSGVNVTFYHIDFRDDKNGWVVGERGMLLRTTDGGETWTPAVTNVNVTLLSVQFLNDDEGWAIGRGGTILRSGDQGRTWTLQASTTKQNLYSLHFNKKIGWAVGGQGIVLRYERE
ncbi:MAG TPA: YCF48-related protein [Pyrinomonadaceae bacterium]|nr:YCF48-related protein [Pyrinomonadaceae bacterium]